MYNSFDVELILNELPMLFLIKDAQPGEWRTFFIGKRWISLLNDYSMIGSQLCKTVIRFNSLRWRVETVYQRWLRERAWDVNQSTINREALLTVN